MDRLNVNRWIDAICLTRILGLIINTINQKKKSFTNESILLVVCMTDSIGIDPSIQTSYGILYLVLLPTVDLIFLHFLSVVLQQRIYNDNRFA
jgi:hypothetical protein